MIESSKPRLAPKFVPVGVMALLGVILFVTVVHNDLAALSASRSANAPTGLIIRYALAMAIGGALAGFALSRLFGRTGVLGWIWALIAGILATIGSGLIGGLFGRLPELLSDGFQAGDLIAVAAGTLILPFALGDDVWLAILWLAMILAAHVWKRHLQNRQT
ncbi:MAG: hypothetical protein ACR2O8_15370 [Rhizobiaceae bacterium]